MGLDQPQQGAAKYKIKRTKEKRQKKKEKEKCNGQQKYKRQNKKNTKYKNTRLRKCLDQPQQGAARTLVPNKKDKIKNKNKNAMGSKNIKDKIRKIQNTKIQDEESA